MLNRVNRVVYGAIHRLCTRTYRQFGLDNYAWAVIVFLVAGITSALLAGQAWGLASAETNAKVADMRRQSALFGVAISSALAVAVFFAHQTIRKYATRHYDIGKGINPLLSIFGWLPVVLYLIAIPISILPGPIDFAIFGVGIMFLLSEPPPMEDRMDRAFRAEAPEGRE